MQRVGRFGWKLNRTIHRSALLLSVLSAVAGGLAALAVGWWVLAHLLDAQAQSPSRFDVGKLALAVTVVAGGAVLLVVVYRRQRDQERGRFAELFGAAARQLGDPDPAVRIAGVYAMAGVADEFAAPGRRQQCVDVLCGYLRLPYVPDEGASHLVSKSQRVSDAGTSVERVYAYRNNDRQVRHTIVRVLADRLRRSAETSWSTCDFDFSEVIFQDADFRDVVFAGRVTCFADAIFVGDRTCFDRARFVGGRTVFRRAIFRDTVGFERAIFAPALAAAADADDTGTVFDEAVFTGSVSFEKAVFAGSRAAFVRTTFGGPHTSFARASFPATVVSFERTLFDGGTASFIDAEFTGGTVDFTATRFLAEACSFDSARVGAQSRWRGRTRDVSFARAEYHGKVSFTDAVFAGRSVTFSGGDFFGDISFRRAAFDARIVTFDLPRAWAGVHVDWEADPATKPANISPEHWPPAAPASEPEHAV